MVVFTCSYCGESLKKNRVEKHYTFQKCRGNSPALTCVDCLKDFFGQDFVAHTSCVTEEERYSAKGFKSKPPSDKGKKKQELWIELINEILNEDMEIKPNARNLLQRIAEEPNVPQKKPKFINFCSSKFKYINRDCVEQAWEVLENVKLKLKGANQNESKEESKDDSIDRKRKRVDSGNLSPNDESFNNSSVLKPENGDFNPSKSQKKPKRNESQSGVEEETVGKKKDKKSKKNNGYADNNDYVDDFKANGTESNSIDSRNSDIHENKDTPNNEQTENSEFKLSKKEKKQKRKKEKYEKQLLEINEAVPEKVLDGTDDITPVNLKKMKKKDVQVADKYCAIESELNGETGNGKKKKKCQELLPEINEVEELENGADVDCTKRNKFNWEEIIIKVLEAKGELPLKRLEKKVVSEYMNTCETVKSVEEALAKFHKKVMKIPRVKVRKEVAKLVS